MNNDGMPKRTQVERQDAGKVPAEVVFVRRYFTAEGRPYADCWDPNTMRTWRSVPVLTWGGGPDSYAHFPLAVDPTPGLGLRDPEGNTGAQATVVYRGKDRRPLAVGAIFHPKTGLRPLALPSAGASINRVMNPSKDDLAVKFAGVTGMVHADGDVTVDMADDHVFRLQLGPTGAMRISRNAAALDNAALAAPLQVLLTDMIVQMEIYRLAFAELATGLTALSVPVTQTTAAGASTTPAPPGGEIKSAALKLSTDSEPV